MRERERERDREIVFFGSPTWHGRFVMMPTFQLSLLDWVPNGRSIIFATIGRCKVDPKKNTLAAKWMRKPNKQWLTLSLDWLWMITILWWKVNHIFFWGCWGCMVHPLLSWSLFGIVWSKKNSCFNNSPTETGPRKKIVNPVINKVTPKSNGGL